jgi:ubiquinone/menaquinone biosynthesis C-methylase UbiE
LGFLFRFLRLFFRLLYHELAWTYDFVSAFVSGGRWGAWRDSVIPLIQGPSVLELGFGPGHLLRRLQRQGLKSIGLDASRQMARLAHKNLRSAGLPSQLVRGNGQCLPFCGSSFNCVVATFPTNYIFLPATLSEIERVLLPGGRLIILISAWITDRSLISRVLAWLFRFTGQVLPDQVQYPDLLAPFATTALNSHLKWVTLSGSRLLMIIAEKT